VTPLEKESDERDVDTHFAFGENWASYSRMIDDERVTLATADLRRLVGEDLSGKTVLDIGCGSGLHALAAARLGASRVVAIDVDPQSVATARAVLAERAPRLPAEVHVLSVFDLRPRTFGPFDLVYSWGVLHHTGAMYDAIEHAARCVAPGGSFAFALYRRTVLCSVWKVEKRWYKSAPPAAQKFARSLYTGLLRLAFAASRRSFTEFVASYKKSRGMDYGHDLHDWLGGYPYESISPAETDALLTRLGFVAERRFVRTDGTTIVPGCDEYLYRRRA
jgi:SAM-dependent methyltransferase